jgi:hypothetical protein
MESSGSVATWETTEHRFFAWEVLGNRSGSPHLLLSQTTISSRSFPPTLPLPLPRRATAVQRTVSSQSVPGYQPATHMTPGPASSSTNLLSPSVTRQGVQAAFVQGPKVLRHISGTSSIVRVHSPPLCRYAAATGLYRRLSCDHSHTTHFILLLVHRNRVGPGG